MAAVFSTIFSILIFIVILAMIILIHEFGHYIFAKWTGCLVREFSLGMGPKVYGRKFKTKAGRDYAFRRPELFGRNLSETEYTIRALPIGGFCAIAGEDDESQLVAAGDSVRLVFADPAAENPLVTKIVSDKNVKGAYQELPAYEVLAVNLFDQSFGRALSIQVAADGGSKTYLVDNSCLVVEGKREYQIAPFERTLEAKPKRKQALVMFGGPMMNFVLALFVFLLAGLITGVTNVKSNKVRAVGADSAYAVAGIVAGDRITGLTIDGVRQPVVTWRDYSRAIGEFIDQGTSEELVIDVERDGTQLSFTVLPGIFLNTIGGIEVQKQAGQYVFGEIPKSILAYKAGLRTGDVILAVGACGAKYAKAHPEELIPVTGWRPIYQVFDDNRENNRDQSGNAVTLKINRAGKEQLVTITPYKENVMATQKTLSGEQIPGVTIYFGAAPTRKVSVFHALGYSLDQTVNAGTSVVRTIALLISSKQVSIRNLSGPIGIYSMTRNIAKTGFVNILNWIGLLSVNIGLLNLLPIPALDGGRLVFLAWEGITKKKPSRKVQTALIVSTFILLLGLIVFVSINDIIRLFK